MEDLSGFRVLLWAVEIWRAGKDRTWVKRSLDGGGFEFRLGGGGDGRGGCLLGGNRGTHSG